MSGLFSYFSGRSGTGSRDRAKDAIIDLRQHLILLEKRESHLLKKVDEEDAKARANVTSNKRVALAALRQKKLYETELDKIAGRRMTLETQVNAIENANLNMETMNAMREGAAVLKRLHGGLSVDKVDATMDEVREQMEITNEISDAISNPVLGNQVDEDALGEELAELESAVLDERLANAQPVPAHPVPGPATRLPTAPTQTAADLDEEAELRQLQAELAMA